MNRRVLQAVGVLALLAAQGKSQALLENFASWRNNLGTTPLWQPYLGESVGQTMTVSGGLMNVAASTTNATVQNISAISRTNPAVVTVPSSTTWESQSYLGNNYGDIVTFSGITGTGCNGINGQWIVQKLTSSTFALWTTDSFTTGVDGTGCTYAGGGTGRACQADGCGLYWQFEPNASASIQAYPYPGGFSQSFILSGTWNASFNRLTYTMRCDKSLAGLTTGQTIWNFGDYVKAHGNTTGGFQGAHYYRGLNANINAGVTMNVEVSNVVDHEVSQADNIINYPPNKEYWLPDYNDGNLPVNQFDGQTRFYNQNDSIGYSNQAMWSGNTCHYGNFSYSEVDRQPDTYVHQVVSQYTGTQYEIDFAGAKSAVGFTPTIYQIAYSTSPLTTIGFSKGTSGGTVSSPGSAYMQTQWLSGSMAQAPKMYVGIRPVMRILSLVNAAPVQIFTETDSGLQTGDTIAVANVGGTTTANGNWTVTATPARSFVIGAGTLTSVVCASNICTATTPNPHGLSVGQLAMDLFVTQTEYRIASVPTSTTFTWACSGCTGTYNSGSNPNMGIYAYSGFSLNGSSAGSAWTANTGTVVATTDKANFRQVEIDQTGGTAAVTGNPCDLNGDGVVNVLDVQLFVNMALGISACTADVEGAGVCDVIGVQRIVIAAEGQACQTGS